VAAPPDPFFIPRAEQAVVPPAKLRDYALSSEHPTGRHKARVFATELGIQREHWEYLADQIALRVTSTPVSRIDVDAYGTRYEVVVSTDGLNGATVPVVSAWFIPHEPPDEPPRLVSTYVYRP
jgi:uncharacterized protein DUF6883